MEDLNGGVFTVDYIDWTTFSLRGVNSESMPHYRKGGKYTRLVKSEVGVLESVSFLGNQGIIELIIEKSFIRGDVIILSDTNTTADGKSFVVSSRNGKTIELENYGIPLTQS